MQPRRQKGHLYSYKLFYVIAFLDQNNASTSQGPPVIWIKKYEFLSSFRQNTGLQEKLDTTCKLNVM
jgi:hypothetical protein